VKLSDIMSAAGLARYAEVALVIFFAVFVAIAIWLVISRRPAWERAARLPLEDGIPQPSRAGEN
jgi:hypothetical protein